MFDRASYLAQLQALLPIGAAWTRAPDANLTKLLAAFAEEFVRLDGRAFQLIAEADPRTALELLTDWERVCGLPDACVPVTGSVRERQLAVVSKLAGIGGQSRAYFIGLAGTLGFTIDIEETGRAKMGDRCGVRCNGDVWAFTWRVNVVEDDDANSSYQSAWARSGQSRCGERIRSFGSGQLECLIRRAAPAHTNVIFAYPEEPEPLLWFDFLNP